METIDSTADVTAGNVLTMYSENENISGYCVDILEDGYPNGYVVVTLTDMIIPEKTAGLLVCQNDEGEEKFLVNWSGTSLCCCFYDSHD